MKINLAVFSCSRFQYLRLALQSYLKTFPTALWQNSVLHEDVFIPGLATEVPLIEKFKKIYYREPRGGLARAFFSVYSDFFKEAESYTIHLEDDWVFQGALNIPELVSSMQERDLIQIYFSSKKTLEEAVLRANREPDCYFDNGRLGLFIVRRHADQLGHLMPNTTPHLGAPDLFKSYVELLQKPENQNLFSETTPRRAWGVWRELQKNPSKTYLRYGVLVQREVRLIKHIGIKHRFRIPNRK